MVKYIYRVDILLVIYSTYLVNIVYIMVIRGIKIFKK